MSRENISWVPEPTEARFQSTLRYLPRARLLRRSLDDQKEKPIYLASGVHDSALLDRKVSRGAAVFNKANDVHTELPEVELLKTHLAREEMERDIAAHSRKLRGRIDGIVAASGLIAMTALRGLTDHGVVVPDMMRMIGYDDLPLPAQTVPRLSTIRQDIAKGAEAMMDALSRRLAGEASPSVVLDPTLITRDST